MKAQMEWAEGGNAKFRDLRDEGQGLVKGD